MSHTRRPPARWGAVRWGGSWSPARRPRSWRLAVAAFALVAIAGCATDFGGSGDTPPLREWSPEQGWIELPEGTSSPTAAALRAEARKAFESGAYEDALKGIYAMQREFSGSTEAKDSETHFLIAECHLKLGAYEKAYDNYQEALKRGAGGSLLNRTLNRIYHIGLFFLQGKAKRSFAGIPFNSPSFGVDILIGEKGLFTRYENLDYADDGLLEIARHYFEKKQYPEAEKIYDRLVKRYPDSEWAELAEYQLAVTVFKQVRGVDYDQGPLKKAKRLFNTYRVHYPRGVHVEKVRDYLDRISEMEAQHDLKVAKYYIRESRPEAAMYYLREVLLNNPRTDAAREAREMYRQMARFRGIETDEETEDSIGGSS